MSEHAGLDEHEVNPRREEIHDEVEFFTVLNQPDELVLIDPRNMPLGEQQTRLSNTETRILQEELHAQFQIEENPTPTRRYLADVAEDQTVVVQVLRTNQSESGIFLHESTSTDRPFWAIGPEDEEIQEFPES